PVFLTVRVLSGATRQVRVGTGAVPSSGIFSVEAIAAAPTGASTAGNAIEARLGASDGPILGECEVRVFGPARVTVAPHVLTVHTVASGAAAALRDGTAPSIDTAAVFRLVKAVWRQAGVELNVQATRRHPIFSAPLADTLFFWGNAVGEIGWMMG